MCLLVLRVYTASRLSTIRGELQWWGALSRQLGWSHFVELLPITDALKRELDAELCRVERWSVRTLRDKMGGMLFERTALSRKPAELAR